MDEYHGNDAEAPGLRAALLRSSQRERELETAREAMLFLMEELEANRLQIEHAKQEWTAVFDAIRDPVMLHDRESRIVRANQAYARVAGVEFNDFIGRHYWEIFPLHDGPLPGCRSVVEAAASIQEARTTDEQIVLPTGDIYLSHAYPARDAQGDYLFAVHIFENITAQVLAAQTLSESEEKFRSISNAAQDAIIMADSAGRISFWNGAAERIFGYVAAEALGCDMHTLIAPVRHHDASVQGFRDFRASGEGTVVGQVRELVALRKDGSEFPIELSIGTVRLKDEWNTVGVVRDITARKQAEGLLQGVNRALRVLSECNAALVHAADEATLLATVCRILVETGSYRMAWVGFAEQDEGKSVVVVAQHGCTSDYLKQINISWADSERGQGPTGTAIRTAKTQIAQDLHSDPRMAPWRDQAIRCGFASSIALPLKEGQRMYGTLTIYAHEADAFNPDEVRLLEEMADDLAYGITVLRLRTERDRILEAQQHHEEILRRSLEDSIQAIAATVEMRDPFTAGHQRRVAQLCVAIAGELGLDANRIQGLKLAAVVHDVGKIQIPAEILSKPRTLNATEFELIKVHPRVGFDIIKDVQYPWPIAQMILQHHEHLDGTGYPQGLRGEEILLESRILAVADVVEAMDSHRPYRPASGIEAALQEIIAHRGTWFDPDAVDACVRLFRERHFSYAESY